MRTHRGEDGQNADCLKSKAGLPLEGGLAFVFLRLFLGIHKSYLGNHQFIHKEKEVKNEKK